MIPKRFLMMLVTCVSEFVQNDVVSELWGKSHQFSIETNRIMEATTPPSSCLMTTGHRSIDKTMFLCQVFYTIGEKYMSKMFEFQDPFSRKWDQGVQRKNLFLYPAVLLCHKFLDSRIRHTIRRTNHDFISRIDSHTHPTETGHANDSDGKRFNPRHIIWEDEYVYGRYSRIKKLQILQESILVTLSGIQFHHYFYAVCACVLCGKKTIQKINNIHWFLMRDFSCSSCKIIDDHALQNLSGGWSSSFKMFLL